MPTSFQVPDYTAGQSSPVLVDIKIFVFCAFLLPVKKKTGCGENVI